LIEHVIIVLFDTKEEGDVKNLKFRLEKDYIGRQDISAYKWTKIFVTFFRSRVVKKNPSKGSRINFLSYEGFDYGQNRGNQKNGGKANKFMSGHKMEHEILFCSTEGDMRFIK